MHTHLILHLLNVEREGNKGRKFSFRFSTYILRSNSGVTIPLRPVANSSYGALPNCKRPTPVASGLSPEHWEIALVEVLGSVLTFAVDLAVGSFGWFPSNVRSIPARTP